MNINRLFFVAIIAAITMASTSVFAQETPAHPMYVDFGGSWVDLLDTWEPGTPFSSDPSYIDDNFFISRVPLKARFTHVNTQANKELVGEKDKNVAWWSPIGIGDKSWGPLPRYTFEADNFNMWQYLNIHGNWSNSWLRVPGAFNDVAHKNGVVTGCTYFVEWAADVSEKPTASIHGKELTKLASKDAEGKFKYAEKFVQMLKYYGIDGVGLNPEGNWSSSLAANFQNFLIECHRVGEELNWPFRVDWYSFVSNTGGLGDPVSLNDNCKNWFQKDGSRVTDMFFLNYNWTANTLTTSEQKARELGRSPKDVYAGFDQQGRGYGAHGSVSNWAALASSSLSFVVWGGHAKSELYKSSSQYGTTDLAIQNTYQRKLERLFVGGTRNVLKTPNITTASVSPSEADLEKFHGYSKVASAKSTLADLPFVTRFNLGNGQWFKKEGVTTFDHKWYNIGMQDYLPTWRWWIADDAGNVPAKAIQCDFTFDDAWFGGSALKIHGETEKSNIRLFKTQFAVVPTMDITVTYKVNKGTDPKMRLLVATEGNEDNPSSLVLPPAEAVGRWHTASFKLKDLGVSSPKTIVWIGVAVDNTDAGYEVLLGEMSLMNPTKKYNPATPTITHALPLRRVYNSVDAKVVFESSPVKAKGDGTPVYNEEVDTWYFEVFVKQEEQAPVLVTTTTSWASYVAFAPLSNTEDPNFRLGVRAVAPDGKTYSDIAWTELMTIELTPVETLVIDKSIIKPNEVFSIGFEDPNHDKVTFEIIKSATGEVVYSESEVIQLTTSLPDLGCYDVRTIKGDNEVTTRSLIIITPVETGFLPRISSLVADKTKLDVNESTQINYTAEKGEGYVSQGIYISDPYMFKVNSKIVSGYPFTYSLWFKPEILAHGAKGTVLMHKLSKANLYTDGKWTTNNWGEMWTCIRPENMEILKDAVGGNTTKGGLLTGPNELSLNTYGGVGGSKYPHEDIVDDAISTGYSITPGVWTHLAITMDANKKQCMYINGRKVFETTSKWTSKLDNTHFYIGGSVQNLSAFVGWIDEVQIWSKALSESEVLESMDGYFNAPEGLQGYFTFEDVNEDGTFPNQGVNPLVEFGEIVEWQTDPGDTKKTLDVQRQPDLALGVPALEGVRQVIFESAKWTLSGADYVAGENLVNVKYAQDGTYSIKLTLQNSWGETSQSMIDYIVVGTGNSGISKADVAEDLSIYPIPFKETTTIRFATAGKYTVNVYALNGRLMGSEAYLVDSGDFKTLSLDAPSGTYYINIMKDGKHVRTFKVIKQ